MDQQHATVRLGLDSIPACVTLVRSMLSGLGERLGLDSELTDDIKTAVSEACNNVVLHAYPDVPGPFAVQLTLTPERLDVVITDHGCGIRRVAAAREDRMGVGLAVISALADTAEFSSEPGDGTVVRMSFSPRGRELDAFLTDPSEAERRPVELTGEILLTVAPVTLLGSVLGRVARAVAAGAHFSLDRFADLYLIVDEVAAHAQGAALHDSVSCAISSQTGRLELGLGEFTSGALRERFAAAGDAVPLAKLVNDLTISQDGDGELMTLLVVDQSRAA